MGSDLAFRLARVFPERKVAFFWVGAPGQGDARPLGGGNDADYVSLHVAFQVAVLICTMRRARLQKGGIQPRDFAGLPTEEPVVLAWMPAASVYFRDPDNNLLEFITMLPDSPRPESRSHFLERLASPREKTLPELSNLVLIGGRSQICQISCAEKGWALLPLRLMVGFGFAAHGYAKLNRGPENFAIILTAIGVPSHI